MQTAKISLKMFTHFNTINERDGRTDRQTPHDGKKTDRQTTEYNTKHKIYLSSNNSKMVQD